MYAHTQYLTLEVDAGAEPLLGAKLKLNQAATWIEQVEVQQRKSSFCRVRTKNMCPAKRWQGRSGEGKAGNGGDGGQRVVEVSLLSRSETTLCP